MVFDQIQVDKNLDLFKAVKSDDVEKVRELLEQGADPNYWPQFLLAALENKKIEIVKLLIKFGFTVRDDFLDYIFNFKSVEHITELLQCIINHNKDIKVLHKIFDNLLFATYEKPTMLWIDILKLLIDNRMSINSIEGPGYTPLHCFIILNKPDFVLLLLQHGADVNKKTPSDGINFMGIKSILSIIFLKFGMLHATTDFLCDKSPLNLACIYSQLEILRVLLKHGAELKMSDFYEDISLLTLQNFRNQNFLVENLALAKFEQQPISDANLKFLSQNNRLQKKFNSCFIELEKLKSFDFNGFTLYDILRMRRQPKKLTFLTKNENLVTAFTWWNRKSFKNYGEELDYIFNKALKARDILQSEENKLELMFKDYNLPDLVLQKITCLLNDNLFL